MENRKRGAKKAAETRKAKRHVSRCESADRWFCGQCALEYDESIEENWIECSLCLVWYHFKCEQVVEAPPENINYICLKCKS